MQAFGVLGADDRPLDLDAAAASASPTALAAVWRGETESDSLQPARHHRRPATGAQVEVLRAYRRYRQRIGSRYTESLPERRIAANPEHDREADAALRAALRPGARGATRRAEAGAARGDPRRPRRRRAARPRPHPAQPARADRRDGAHERLTSRAATSIAFKLRSADVPAIPQPAPLLEIYVYAPDDGGHPPARRARSRAAASAGRTAWTTAPRSSASCARR